MVQQLKALADLPEDVDSIPSPYQVVRRLPSPIDTLFWSPWVPDTQVVNIHTNRQNTHKNNFKN